jgi:hypothetical protein
LRRSDGAILAPLSSQSSVLRQHAFRGRASCSPLQARERGRLASLQPVADWRAADLPAAPSLGTMAAKSSAHSGSIWPILRARVSPSLWIVCVGLSLHLSRGSNADRLTE